MLLFFDFKCNKYTVTPIVLKERVNSKLIAS